MRALAGWCVSHRRVVVIGWLVALIGLSVASQSVGSNYKDSFSLPGTQSFEALNLLQRAAPKAAGDREQIVVAVKQGKVTDPAVRSRVEAMLRKVAALGDVAAVASPYGTTGSAQISSSGRIAFANVTLTKQAAKISTGEAKTFVDTAKAGAGSGVQVEVEGQVAKAANRTSVSTTGLGAAAALVVLLLVFGSLLAATLPLLTAGIALGSSVAVVALLSHLLNIDDLQRVAEANRKEREAFIPAAEQIVAEEVRATRHALDARESAPTIQALVTRIAHLRDGVLERHLAHVPAAEVETRQAMRELAEALTARFLDGPIRALRESPDPTLGAAVMHDAFDLDIERETS